MIRRMFLAGGMAAVAGLFAARKANARMPRPAPGGWLLKQDDLS